jgi:hypothetical protein
MLLSDYVADLTTTIDQYTRTGLILSSDVTTDYRTDKIGFIKGFIVFLDDSKLLFKEFVNVKYTLDKSKYSFHYQAQDGTLIFRYDNAVHKPALKFRDHKHVGDEVYHAEIPTLKDILEEIIYDVLITKMRKEH